MSQARALTIMVTAALGLWLGGACDARAQPGAGFHEVAPPSSPSAAELERAHESFERGLVHSEQGRWPAAALAFEEAYRRSGNPVALFNWASAERESGAPGRARELVVALRARHAGSLDSVQLTRANQLYAETTAVLELREVPDAARTWVDGQPLPPPRFELAPGAHRLRLEAPGRQPFTWQGALDAQQRLELRVQALPLPPPHAAPDTTPEPASEHDAPQARRRRRAGWAVLGSVVLASIAVGLSVGLSRDSTSLRPPQGVDVYRMP